MSVSLVNRLHHQRVGDDDAVVAPCVAKEAGQDFARQRRRIIRVELRVHDVRRHDGRRVVLQRAKGQQLQRLQRALRLVDDGKIEVRIHVACRRAREVLDTAGDAFPQRTAHPGGAEARDIRRIGRKAALGDHRVRRVVVDVQHRREIPIEAQAADAARHRRPDVFGQLPYRRRRRAPSRRAPAAAEIARTTEPPS